MANNIAITAGSGTTVKTDQLADGTHVQYMKLLSATEDSTTGLTIDATYGLPVDLTRSVALGLTGTVASGSADTGNPVKIGGKYNTTLPTFADAQRGDLQIDGRGRVIVTLGTLIAGEDLTNSIIGVNQKPVSGSTYTTSNYQNFGTVTKINVKAAAGNIYSVRITNDNAAVRYFQIHNKATAPVATEVPSRAWKIPAGTATAPGILLLDTAYLSPSAYLSTGVGWAISTTATTFTDAATASEHNVDINYI